jgi:hypothetical protein
MPLWTMPASVSALVGALAACLDPRSRPRFWSIFFGLLVCREKRRTAAAWFRAAGIGADFRRAYDAIGSVGRRADRLATVVLTAIDRVLAAAPDRYVFALDDTPTKRYGPHVEGAGVHHNPTPGPANQSWVYGHVWVTLARVIRHPCWGAIGLPVRAALYVRAKDVPAIPAEYHWSFRTKLQLAVELIGWLAVWLGSKGKPLWLVADGAYARREVLRAARAAGVWVVSRLRHDAALWTVPDGKRPKGKRGRKPKYGDRRIRLAGRASARGGWVTGEVDVYNRYEDKTYKTFLATWPPAGGVIRVVLVDEPTGWRAYFCTDPAATVADILTTVADRFSLEITFRDCKEVVGAGQQQVRFVRASLGAFHVCLWTFTLTEAWAWSRPEDELVDRSDSPWDSPLRRPSHADKRRAWRRAMLGEEIRAVLRPGVTDEEIQATADRLLNLAA